MDKLPTTNNYDIDLFIGGVKTTYLVEEKDGKNNVSREMISKNCGPVKVGVLKEIEVRVLAKFQKMQKGPRK